jgi:hypothetical protein
LDCSAHEVESEQRGDNKRWFKAIGHGVQEKQITSHR